MTLSAPWPSQNYWQTVQQQAIGLNLGLSANTSRLKRSSESDLEGCHNENKKRFHFSPANFNQTKDLNQLNNRKKLTVYATKVNEEYLDKAKLIELLETEFDIDKSSIAIIKYTIANNCMIEFKDEDNFNKLANKNATFCQDNGKVTPLNISDQNNYVIIKGISKESMDKIENINSLTSDLGIISYDDLAKAPPNTSSMDHSGTNRQNILIVKALCACKEKANKLIKSGIILNYERFTVKAYITPAKVTVCYNCASFNHHAVNCKNEAKCFKCSENHPSWECKTVPSKSKNSSSLLSTNPTNPDSFKCPGCNGKHPQTYAKCPAYQTALKNIRHNKNQPSYRVESANPAPINPRKPPVSSNPTSYRTHYPINPPPAQQNQMHTASNSLLTTAIQNLSSKFDDLILKLDSIYSTVQANTETISKLTTRIELIESTNQVIHSKNPNKTTLNQPQNANETRLPQSKSTQQLNQAKPQNKK